MIILVLIELIPYWKEIEQCPVKKTEWEICHLPEISATDRGVKSL